MRYILKAFCAWLIAQTLSSIVLASSERNERGKNLDLNDVCPLKIQEMCISILSLFYEYAYDLPQLLNTAYHASAY